MKIIIVTQCFYKKKKEENNEFRWSFCNDCRDISSKITKQT